MCLIWLHGFYYLSVDASLYHVNCIQYTIEEKVIERAYKKLALDALVIQQGRLAEQKSKASQECFIFCSKIYGLYKVVHSVYVCSCK